MRFLFTTLTTALLLLSMPASAQQIYKWVDKDGTVHFTDSPPEETVNAERRAMSNNARGNVTAPEEGNGTKTDPDDLDALYSPEQRANACQQARANHTTLTTMSTITQDLNGDGVAEELNEEQKAAALERSETQIRLLCVDDES